MDGLCTWQTNHVDLQFLRGDLDHTSWIRYKLACSDSDDPRHRQTLRCAQLCGRPLTAQLILDTGRRALCSVADPSQLGGCIFLLTPAVQFVVAASRSYLSFRIYPTTSLSP